MVKRAIKEVWEFVCPIFSEWDEKYNEYALSLGRCSFWVVLGVSVIRFWVFGNDIPENLLWVLGILLTYNVGKQVPKVVKDIKLNDSTEVNLTSKTE
jgi:hypothetical protein